MKYLLSSESKKMGGYIYAPISGLFFKKERKCIPTEAVCIDFIIEYRISLLYIS